MILEEPEEKETIITQGNKMKGLLATGYEVMGSDFCIDKGVELNQALDDYFKYYDSDDEE